MEHPAAEVVEASDVVATREPASAEAVASSPVASAERPLPDPLSIIAHARKAASRSSIGAMLIVVTMMVVLVAFAWGIVKTQDFVAPSINLNEHFPQLVAASAALSGSAKSASELCQVLDEEAQMAVALLHDQGAAAEQVRSSMQMLNSKIQTGGGPGVKDAIARVEAAEANLDITNGQISRVNFSRAITVCRENLHRQATVEVVGWDLASVPTEVSVNTPISDWVSLLTRLTIGTICVFVMQILWSAYRFASQSAQYYHLFADAVQLYSTDLPIDKYIEVMRMMPRYRNEPPGSFDEAAKIIRIAGELARKK